MPERIQISRQRKWKPPLGKLYLICDRRGPWGNPFDNVDSFRAWLATGTVDEASLLPGYHKYILSTLDKHREWILKNLSALGRYDYLCCWCPPERLCHVDVLIEMVSALAESEAK